MYKINSNIVRNNANLNDQISIIEKSGSRYFEQILNPILLKYQGYNFCYIYMILAKEVINLKTKDIINDLPSHLDAFLAQKLERWDKIPDIQGASFWFLNDVITPSLSDYLFYKIKYRKMFNNMSRLKKIAGASEYDSISVWDYHIIDNLFAIGEPFLFKGILDRIETRRSKHTEENKHYLFVKGMRKKISVIELPYPILINCYDFLTQYTSKEIYVYGSTFYCEDHKKIIIKGKGILPN